MRRRGPWSSSSPPRYTSDRAYRGTAGAGAGRGRVEQPARAAGGSPHARGGRGGGRALAGDVVGPYAYATDGCFCAITGSTGYPTAAWIYPTLRVTSAPALWGVSASTPAVPDGNAAEPGRVDGCHVRRAEGGISAGARDPRRAPRLGRPLPCCLIAAGVQLHRRPPKARSRTLGQASCGRFRRRATLETLPLPHDLHGRSACEPGCPSRLAYPGVSPQGYAASPPAPAPVAPALPRDPRSRSA